MAEGASIVTVAPWSTQGIASEKKYIKWEKSSSSEKSRSSEKTKTNQLQDNLKSADQGGEQGFEEQ